MSRIFFSHSSRDNRQAVALKKWLAEQRPELANEIFLDIDPESGLQVGARWKGQLFESNSRCEAVICLLSRSWEASAECKTEYRTAEGLGKQILVARLEDLGGSDITSEWQRCDLFAQGAQTEIAVPRGDPVRFNTAALYALRKAIEGTGVGPQNFVWPPKTDPQRAPYRGWEPFEDIDAGVFFGRDAAIVRGLDELRTMRFPLLARLAGRKSFFVVLGPSGAGKSSFLRAGLIPRLQREDRRFLVLGILRPQRAALTGDHGLAAAIDTANKVLKLAAAPLGEIKNACLHEPDRVVELLVALRAVAGKRLADAGQDGSAPTLVLPLDQAEELFSGDAGPEAGQFLTLIAELIRRINASEVGLAVAATIRTDRYEMMQDHPALDGLGTVLFDELKPMPPTQFKEVITGPAARASEGGQRLVIAPDLINRLLADAAEGADTLPLLALTLARLYADYASTGQLTLAHYEAIGGMPRVVQIAIDGVLSTDPTQRAQQLQLLRAAFIPWLATINPDNDQPMRRVARESDLPEQSRPLIDALVEKRLLVRDERDGQVVVEVALESLLRQWDELAGWLREERLHLKTADDIERNTTAWETHHHDPAWLLTGTRLADAETLANTAGFRDRLARARDYLAASRDAENQRLAAEEQQRQTELRHAQQLAQAAQEREQTAKAHAADLHRRSQILRRVLAGTAVVAVVALVGAVVAVIGFRQATTANHQAQNRFREATSLRLVAEAQSMLAHTRSGGDVRAFQQLVAARRLAQTPNDGPLLSVLEEMSNTREIIETPAVVESVAFSPDGKRIVSGGDDKTVRLWDATTGQPVGQPMTGHTGRVNSVAFSPDGKRILSGDDKTVRLWDATTGQPVGQPMTGHKYGVTSVAFSPDGKRIVSGSDDGTVRLWSADTGQPVGAPLTGDPAQVLSVAFSPDGRRIASGGSNNGVRLWDADTRQPIGQPTTGAMGLVSSVAFSPDGKRIVSGGGYGDYGDNSFGDNTVRLWDADTGQPIGQPMTGHTDAVQSVAFSPDGKRIVSGSRDKTVRLWDADTGQPIGQPMTRHTDAVQSVAYSPDGKRIVSGSRDNTVRLWNADTGQLVIGQPRGGQHTAGVLDVAFSPDGRSIASASFQEDGVRLWDADTGQPVGQPLVGRTGHVSSVAFSPDGHRIVSGSDDGTVQVWDATTSQPVGQPMMHEGVNIVAFSPDGRRIVSCSGSSVRVWDAATGQPVGQPMTHEGVMAFSPDGKRIVSGGDDKTVRLWDASTGQPVGQPMTGHTGGVNSAAFSRDGRRIVSGSDDGTVRVWNADTGQPMGQLLTGHQGLVRAVAFSPDGRRIVSGGNDDTVRLWDADTGQPLGKPLTGHRGGVDTVAYSPDGERIASGGYDTTVRLWPAYPNPAAALCAKITTNMTHQQWRNWVSPDIDYIEACPGLPIPADA